MKAALNCASRLIYLFNNQCELATGDPKVREKALRSIYDYMSRNFSFSEDPYTRIGTEIDGILKRQTGNPDPYRALKEEANRRSKRIAAGLKPKNLAEALRVALAGNALDFANVPPKEAYGLLEKTLKEKLDIDDTKMAVGLLEKAKRITFVADNAGEVFFDKLLIDKLRGKRIKLIVRGKPLANDAMAEDAEAAGIKVDEVVGYPRFGYFEKEKDLVLAKGQAAYVTLTELNNPATIHVMKLKCPEVAAHVGSYVGANVIKVVEN
jgi:uncharacterized protein with ATP-grasp and redox domains